MDQIIAITAHADIKSPILQKMYKDVVGSIVKQVITAVAEEVGSVIEALEGAVAEAVKESKGGAK